MKFQSCDYSFNCIPNAHGNHARVARPFLPHASDAIHPALQKREGSVDDLQLSFCKVNVVSDINVL